MGNGWVNAATLLRLVREFSTLFLPALIPHSLQSYIDQGWVVGIVVVVSLNLPWLHREGPDCSVGHKLNLCHSGGLRLFLYVYV